MNTKNFILGTAGHIDHGKSSLVKALTGTDPDRLKEEKLRGITIDLGFANIAYSDGINIGIVDVPGHEKLIKNMLAGAGGIDILLFVVAADEGIMPQTKEHFAICRLLNISTGLIALTKSDIVDDDWIALMTDEIKSFVRNSFLEDAPIIPVSSKTGHNIDVLKQRIHSIAHKITPKGADGIFRLPIDRVFTLKGFGTVVTGTIISGTVHLDEQVEILPSNIISKVKGLQTHGKNVNTAFAGQRTGINLQGVDRAMLKRGDVITVCDKIRSTLAIDVVIELTEDAPTLKSRSNVHFYCGTAETIARVVLYQKAELLAGQKSYGQLRLDEPIVCLSGDRFIIRRFSPLETIGGGVVLDPYPIKRKRSEGISDLEIFAKGDLADKITAKIYRHYCQQAEIEGWIADGLDNIKNAITGLLNSGKLIKLNSYLMHVDKFNALKDTIISLLTQYHKANPLKSGISKSDIKTMLKTVDDKLFDCLLDAINEVVVDKDIMHLKTFNVSLSAPEQDLKNAIVNFIDSKAFQPPDRSAIALELKMSEKQTTDMLKLMATEGLLVRINDSTYLTNTLYDKMLSLLRSAFSKKPEMTVSEFKDLLNTSRKYAIALLEHLDSKKITLRIGDIRKCMLK